MTTMKHIPVSTAEVVLERERDGTAGELEFQLKWKRKPKPRT